MCEVLMSNESKRGPKPFGTASRNRLMPVSQIARQLDISVRTVNYDLRHGITKLQRNPVEAYLLIQGVR